MSELPPTEAAGPITVQLSNRAQQALWRNVQTGAWTADAIVEHLIQEHLHSAYPGIMYRGVEIAEEGSFRAFDRKNERPAMLFRSTLGRYRITPRTTNAEYQTWLQVYQKRDLPDFQDKAVEMCLFLLQEALQQLQKPGEKHIVYPEDFLVERFTD